MHKDKVDYSYVLTLVLFSFLHKINTNFLATLQTTKCNIKFSFFWAWHSGLAAEVLILNATGCHMSAGSSLGSSASHPAPGL